MEITVVLRAHRTASVTLRSRARTGRYIGRCEGIATLGEAIPAAPRPAPFLATHRAAARDPAAAGSELTPTSSGPAAFHPVGLR